MDNPGIPRFHEMSVVRLAEGSSQAFAAVVRGAVTAINAHLPADQQLVSGSSVPAGVSVVDTPDGTIVVESTPTSAYWAVAGMSEYRLGAEGISQSEVVFQQTPREGRPGYRFTRSALVWHSADAARQYWLPTVIHELVHAARLPGHLPQYRFPDSIMRDQTLPRSTTLPTIDGDAVNALYTRLPVGPRPDEISAASLGPWDDTRFFLKGEYVNAGIAFGGSMRIGDGRAWAQGERPDMDRSENPALSGTASWTGALFGVAPEDRAVGGAAAIAVNLGTMDGDARFTELESWGVPTAPRTPGTGTRRLDGDLSYAIDVIGNRFRETGGDAGNLEGLFVGAGHEGAIGPLERTDLTASFGATR